MKCFINLPKQLIIIRCTITGIQGRIDSKNSCKSKIFLTKKVQSNLKRIKILVRVIERCLMRISRSLSKDDKNAI